MQNQLCVSTYSVRQLFGPAHLTFRGPDGKKAPFTWGEGEPSLTLLEFPALVKEKLRLDAVEICQMHVPEISPKYLGQLKHALDDAGVRGGQKRSWKKRLGRVLSRTNGWA